MFSLGGNEEGKGRERREKKQEKGKWWKRGENTFMCLYCKKNLILQGNQNKQIAKKNLIASMILFYFFFHVKAESFIC